MRLEHGKGKHAMLEMRADRFTANFQTLQNPHHQRAQDKE
jgi:hypothetical protein